MKLTMLGIRRVLLYDFVCVVMWCVSVWALVLETVYFFHPLQNEFWGAYR